MDQNNENIDYIEQFYQEQGYNDSNSENLFNLTEDYTMTPLNLPKNNINISASTSSSNNNRFTPYSHPKYGVFKPMEWTSQTIMALLQTTNDGRFIMTDAKVNNGHLSDEAQNSLTKLLINYLFQDKSRGTDFYFRKIASLIIEIFPKEQEKLYFIPSCSANNSHAKGKLVERWKNVSRRLRSIGAIDCERKSKCANEISPAVITFSDETEAAKVWLSQSGLSSDLEQVIPKWKLTYEIRKSEIHGTDILKRHLSEIFKVWPILCSPKGYMLVYEDFNLEYPNITNLLHDWPTFIKKWTYFSNNLVSFRRNSVKDNYGKDLLKQLDAVQLSGNTRTCNVLKLLLIPYLVPTKTQIKTNKNLWKPSLVESAAAFVVHVTNLTGLEAELEKRRQKYIQYGTTIQPFVVLVGKDIFSIEYCYTRVDDQFWTFNCPLEAVDACFKTYMALHCCYPKECYESWIIIQLQLYSLETIYDRHTSVIVSLNSKMNILTHYGRMLLKNGPIKLTSCIRFEAKHKILKAVANAIPCRINLGHTLAYKVQLQMVSRLLSKTGFQHDLKLGTGKEIVVNSEFPALLYNMFPCELAPVCFNASWLKFKGIYYKKGLLMVIDFNLDGCIFGEIVSLLVGKSRNPYFILNPITCIGFDPHYHAYEIENTKEINISNYIGCYINELPDSTPTIARVLENGKIYATLKYAL